MEDVATVADNLGPLANGADIRKRCTRRAGNLTVQVLARVELGGPVHELGEIEVTTLDVTTKSSRLGFRWCGCRKPSSEQRPETLGCFGEHRECRQVEIGPQTSPAVANRFGDQRVNLLIVRVPGRRQLRPRVRPRRHPSPSFTTPILEASA
jgi:hypothetical protein